MRPSIRTFLLINLLLSVTLITSLAIIGNLFLAHKDIQTQLDAQLIRTTQRMDAFFSIPVSAQDFTKIQQILDAHLREKPHPVNPNDTPAQKDNIAAENEARHNLEFQVWDNNGKLLLHSPNSPRIPLSNGNDGLTTLWLDGKAWHVNTSFNPERHLTIMVAERANYRQHLENQLTQDTIIIMLITYPFLGFLIWVIVGRGLDSLKRVAEEVKHRAPSYLKPVDLESVPTEIEPLVIELNNLFGRLGAAFERNKRFTADAAHELKTPLAALSTQTQVALRAETPLDRKQALLKVLASVNRSTHMVQQLLTLSRMDPEASIQKSEAISLGKLAAEVAALLAPEAIAKNIDLELVNPESAAIIQGNATYISILIRNLVDNAIRYNHEGGFVKIGIGETNEHVSLTVTDDGPGISEELRQRVFERFYRVIGNKSTGSGLGLGIVAQIAQLHRVEIDLITPDNKKGIEFRILFPKNQQR
ncbi:MAG: two-component sensor histidine kinase [Coxiella sp. (in: Bacteria)]|nr:MAG: two-component sensor histidine kinase [Coxiella sp. (in: g-proteobacteria)]